MKTTSLTVDFLVSGVLLLVALVLAVPGLPSQALTLGAGSTGWVKAPFFAVALISITYGFGIFFEYLGLILYENRHKRMKTKRCKAFIRKLQEHSILLKRDPFQLAKLDMTKQSDIDTAQDWYTGTLRYFVKNASAELYAEVELQLRRMRIMRVLSIVEVILMVAVISHAITLKLDLYAAVLLFLFLALLFFRTSRGITYRFERYDESIERAYMVLALTPKPEEQPIGLVVFTKDGIIDDGFTWI